MSRHRRLLAIALLVVLALASSSFGDGGTVTQESPYRTPTPMVGEPTSTPTFSGPPTREPGKHHRSHDSEDGGFLDWGLVQTLGPYLFAFIALGGVLQQIFWTRRQAETESGPALRIDIGSPDKARSSFSPPPVHSSHITDVSNVTEPLVRADSTVTFSMWARNTQTHALGTAFTV